MSQVKAIVKDDSTGELGYAEPFVSECVIIVAACGIVCDHK